MDSEPVSTSSLEDQLPPLLYFLGRLMLFLALIPDSYAGPGDLPVYQSWAALPGWPYFLYWSEFPPIFPLLNAGLYRLAGGQQFFYYLLSGLILALAGSASLVLFRRIAGHIWGLNQARLRTWVLLGMLLPLPYTWWYFDLLPLAFMLLGTLWLIEGHSWRSGLAVGIGMLLKWFPGLLLASAWRFQRPGWAGKATAAAVGLVVGVLTGLTLVSPQMSLASLSAQSSRSSWETAWALLDGNMSTGAFLLTDDRLDPSIAGLARGKPPLISPYLTLVLFGGLGAWLFWRARSRNYRARVAFFGLTWVVFLAWSPGWSPQWILYLIPLILLTLPFQAALYGVSGLILLTLIEWPTLLAHAFFSGLWVIVPLRLALFAWLGFRWYRQIRQAA
jgi:hypothetical protein